MTDDDPEIQGQGKVIQFPVGEEAAPEEVEPTKGMSRQLNGDERISFTVFALYLAIFCLCSFLFWNSLALKVLGVTAGLLSAALFVAIVLNPGKAPRKHSSYTRKWYLMSLLSTLLTVFILRVVAMRVSNHVLAVSIIYGTLTLLFVIFRKAMIQVLMLIVAVVFISVTVANWSVAAAGEMGFMDALRASGRTVFHARHIKDVANTLIAGEYLNYLNRVDYRDEQINQVAVRQVLDAGDDELRKTLAILRFVSDDIHYVSDPNDGAEYAKDPIKTLIAGGGDCEDQTVLLCSLLESVGVKTYMAFTDDHVFAFARFGRKYPELAGTPRIFVEGRSCYMLDAADPGARIGYGAARTEQTRRVFDVRSKEQVEFVLPDEG